MGRNDLKAKIRLEGDSKGANKAIKSVSGRFKKLGEMLAEHFGQPARGDAWKINYEKHKVSIMERLLDRLTVSNLCRWNLGDRLDALVERIKCANSALSLETEEVDIERAQTIVEVLPTEGRALPHA